MRCFILINLLRKVEFYSITLYFMHAILSQKRCNAQGYLGIMYMIHIWPPIYPGTPTPCKIHDRLEGFIMHLSS